MNAAEAYPWPAGVAITTMSLREHVRGSTGTYFVTVDLDQAFRLEYDLAGFLPRHKYGYVGMARAEPRELGVFERVKFLLAD